MTQKTSNKLSNRGIAKFSDADAELPFDIWYQNDRCSHALIKGKLPDGIEPSDGTLRRWKKQYGWFERADRLDTAVQKKNDKDLVKEKLAMINRHRKLARELIDQGLNFFRDNKIKSEHVAAKLIVDMAKLERENAGLTALYETAKDMSDNKIMEQIMNLTRGQVDLREDEQDVQT